jgi:hypothetical protein
VVSATIFTVATPKITSQVGKIRLVDVAFQGFLSALWANERFDGVRAYRLIEVNVFKIRVGGKMKFGHF